MAAPSAPFSRLCPWLAVLALSACQGSIIGTSAGEGSSASANSGATGAGVDGTGKGGAGAKRAAAGTTARRLTRFEYDNTVFDLLGVKAKAESEFPTEEAALGFDNNAEALMFSPTLAEQAFSKAEQLGPAAVAKAASFAACVATEKTPSCARTFAAALAARAFRRPAADDELDRIAVVMKPSLDAGQFEHALELSAQVIFSSLPFFYRIELGTGKPVLGKPGLTELTSYERAARLSYALWGTLPDEALTSLASQDGLHDVEQLRSQAERLLADPRARRLIARFHEQWLQLKPVESANHDPRIFPDYTPEVPPLLRQELNAFLDHAAFEGGGLQDIFSAPYTFLNAPLSAFYGISGVQGSDLRLVQLDPTKYAGLLTRAGLLSANAGFGFTSPTRRGAYVRRRLLCQDLPPPPPGVPTTPAANAPGTTRRALVLQHSTDPSCTACHELTDPIGLGLEDFDATGRYRSQEDGKPVDASGNVAQSSLGSFRGGAELGRKLAGSPEAAACFARQVFRYLSGRQEDAPDTALLSAMSSAAALPGTGYREAILSFVTSDSFLYLVKETR